MVGRTDTGLVRHGVSRMQQLGATIVGCMLLYGIAIPRKVRQEGLGNGCIRQVDGRSRETGYEMDRVCCVHRGICQVAVACNRGYLSIPSSSAFRSRRMGHRPRGRAARRALGWPCCQGKSVASSQTDERRWARGRTRRRCAAVEVLLRRHEMRRQRAMKLDVTAHCGLKLTLDMSHSARWPSS